MKRVKLYLLFLLCFTCSLFAEEKERSNLAIELDLENIASFASYNISYYSDSGFSNTISSLSLSNENREIENESIKNRGEFYLKWDINSPYPCSIELSSGGPLYGNAGRYGDEFIPIKATIEPNSALDNSSFNSSNNIWGTTEDFVNSDQGKKPYIEGKKFVSMNNSSAKPNASGSVKISLETGNAYGRAPQNYLCNLVFKVISN